MDARSHIDRIEAQWESLAILAAKLREAFPIPGCPSSHCEVEEPEGFPHSPFLDDGRWTADQITGFARRLC